MPQQASPIGKEEKGGCPLCHQWFLAFYLLSEREYINLIVTTVNMDAPPAAFTQLSASRRVPVAILRPAGFETGDSSNLTVRVCDNNDEIEALMESFGCPGLHLPDNSSPEGQLERDAERSFEDLYKVPLTGACPLTSGRFLFIFSTTHSESEWLCEKLRGECGPCTQLSRQIGRTSPFACSLW